MWYEGEKGKKERKKSKAQQFKAHLTQGGCCVRVSWGCLLFPSLTTASNLCMGGAETSRAGAGPSDHTPAMMTICQCIFSSSCSCHVFLSLFPTPSAFLPSPYPSPIPRLIGWFVAGDVDSLPADLPATYISTYDQGATFCRHTAPRGAQNYTFLTLCTQLRWWSYMPPNLGKNHQQIELINSSKRISVLHMLSLTSWHHWWLCVV